MKSILEYISQTPEKELKAVIEGLSYDDSIFTHLSAERFTTALFEALKDYDNVNESSKTILDCIHDVANGQMVDEGIIAGILGGAIGVAFGPKIGQAICSALNVQKGPLYDLINSRLVAGAICTKLGLRA